jgi:tRNA-dihydrouridine synthase C
MLAPMEGVTDYHLRRILTGIGGYHRCVTEFLRVTDHLYPDKVFYRICPELKTNGATASGTPVYLQLLGSDSLSLARNAERAVALGAVGIDLNFGCPAKTVNRHGGGSALLRTPEVVANIVSAVRDAVDPSVPVTAKMRLGFDDPDNVLEIATLIEQAGATELCIHARTRVDGYRPPAYWSWVRSVTDALSIPVVINGEIWSVSDSRSARVDSGCNDVMLGRGALSVPDLALQLQSSEQPEAGMECQPLTWASVVVLLEKLLESASEFPPRYAGNRTKQWLSYLKRGYPEATTVFERIKRLRSVDDIAVALQSA